MPLDPSEIDRLLAELAPEVRQAAERRLSRVSTVQALLDLIAAAKLDATLQSLVTRAKIRDEGGRKAFDDICREIRAALKSTIRVWIRCKTPEHVEAVEAEVMEAIWLNLHEYQREREFFMTWARTFAKNQAHWYKCRALGAEPPVIEPSVEESYELPPSACFAELLTMIQDREACVAVVFLWNKYLDWKPSAIAEAYGDTPLPDVVAAILKEIVERYPVLARVKVLLAKLIEKAKQNPKRTLRDCLESGADLVESITRWSNEAKRSLGLQVIAQAKDFLKSACEPRVGAHETLSFLWSRPGRRKLSELCARADELLPDLLEEFRTGYAKIAALEPSEIWGCTEPLKRTMQKSPNQRLEDCSKGNLWTDIVSWRDRVQAILLGEARDRRLLAFSYLCGCLPGIEGSARRGV